MEFPKRVTARDVAARAGVAPGTVSKALTGKGSVHPDTRDRIIAIAQELGFQSPHLPAVPPPTERNLTVGLITWEPFGRRRTAPVLLGVMGTLADHDIAFLVCDGRGDPIREQHFVESLLRRNVDGILVMGSRNGSFTRAPLRGPVGVPVVYMMAESTDPGDISVVPDEHGSAELAVRHLLTTGRSRIACILGPEHEDTAAAKTAAVRRVLDEAGLAMAAEPLHGPWTEAWGRQALAQLLHLGSEVDAVLCGNDMIARGAATAIETMGLSVPGDVAVIGFDNWAVMTEGSTPQLSSIDLNLTQVGITAGDMMIEAIEGRRPKAGATVIKCQLVPRESTAVANGPAPGRRRLDRLPNRSEDRR